MSFRSMNALAPIQIIKTDCVKGEWRYYTHSTYNNGEKFGRCHDWDSKLDFQLRREKCS